MVPIEGKGVDDPSSSRRFFTYTDITMGPKMKPWGTQIQIASLGSLPFFLIKILYNSFRCTKECLVMIRRERSFGRCCRDSFILVFPKDFVNSIVSEGRVRSRFILLTIYLGSALWLTCTNNLFPGIYFGSHSKTNIVLLYRCCIYFHGLISQL